MKGLTEEIFHFEVSVLFLIFPIRNVISNKVFLRFKEMMFKKK